MNCMNRKGKKRKEGTSNFRSAEIGKKKQKVKGGKKEKNKKINKRMRKLLFILESQLAQGRVLRFPS